MCCPILITECHFMGGSKDKPQKKEFESSVVFSRENVREVLKNRVKEEIFPDESCMIYGEEDRILLYWDASDYLLRRWEILLPQALHGCLADEEIYVCGPLLSEYESDIFEAPLVQEALFSYDAGVPESKLQAVRGH